jgi:23S rRNA pseudouridine2605 synthase
LARALCKSGHCSRSRASALIIAGRVRLNEVVRRDPETPVQLEKDIIEVDGARVTPGARLYLMLNKRRGVVTTTSDEKGRETVYASLGAGLPWIAPVGRLDKASEGLLLLTNDSEWSARLLAPETHLEKTYHVQVEALVDAALIDSLTKGIATGEGDFLRVKAARVLRSGVRKTWLEIVLDEGKNRQIRRMLAHFGINVKRLVRVAVGPLVLGKLPKGAFRALTADEKLALDKAMASHALRPPRRTRIKSASRRTRSK